MNVQEVQQKINSILEASNVEYAGVFGSVARGSARPDSDVDILVKFKNRPTFQAYITVDADIRRALGLDVDLLTEGSVNKYLRPYVEKDLQIIYGQR